jgi:hypothetical protein
MRQILLAWLLMQFVFALAVANDIEFVVIGDTRPRFESESFAPFEGLIAKINASKPALVVNLGDLIYGYGPAGKHFPVWEPERITPAYYDFWAQTLHPLFKESRVRAVFGGHYHTHGPSREFDGIRYFITGGGGAELRPEYKKSGGEFHFMKIKVSGDAFDVRVHIERGELSDPEADVMGGLQFAARNVSWIGIDRDTRNLRTGVTFSVSVKNPYPSVLSGHATWLLDASAFSVEPQSVSLEIPVGETRPHTFALKALRDTATLQSLPRLEFDVVAAGKHHRFHREVRLVQSIKTPYRAAAPLLDGNLDDWKDVPVLKLSEPSQPESELRSCYDARNLYLTLTVPKFDADEAKESGFSDEIQLGMARRLSNTDFGGDLLRLGFNSDSPEAKDRTPGHKPEAAIRGASSFCRTDRERTIYEITLPLQLLKNFKAGEGSRLVLDLSFPVPESGRPNLEPTEPNVNSFSYRVRYGNDSLVPVYFVELNFIKK